MCEEIKETFEDDYILMKQQQTIPVTLYTQTHISYGLLLIY